MSRFSTIWQPKSLVVIFLDFEQGNCVISAGKFRSDTQSPHELQTFGSLEEVMAHVGKSKAIHLHVLGSGVLSRKIQSSNAFQQDLIMNGNPNEFLFTVFDDGNDMAVSFCRKSLIETYLEEIDTNKWHLYGLSCGPIPVCGILEDESVSTDFSISIKNNRLVSFQRAAEPTAKTLWRGDHWNQKSLIIEGICARLIATEKKWTVYGEDNGDAKRENIEQFNKFKALGLSLVGTIFLALFINYFYQNSLNNDVAQLELDLSVHNENLSMLDRLEQEKRRKEQLISSAGVTSPSFLSFYLDKIGECVPASVTLSEMTVFPVVDKLKDKQKVEVDSRRIWIAGSTKGNEILDDWIEKMDRFDWVKSIELLNYLKSTDEWAEFEIVINLAE